MAPTLLSSSPPQVCARAHQGSHAQCSTWSTFLDHELRRRQKAKSDAYHHAPPVFRLDHFTCFTHFVLAEADERLPTLPQILHMFALTYLHSVIAGAIMISEHAGTPFSVISPAKEFPDKTQLYKLFSTEPIKEDALNDIFSQHKVVATFPWYAYPQFHPPEQYAPFRLGDGLFYSNAIENAASCMEISAISAMNSALLVQQHLNRTVAPKLQGGLTAYNTVAEL